MKIINLFPVFCILFSACSVACGQTAPSHTTPNELTFDKVLIDGNKKMLTALVDIDGDSRKDLILGSNGHEFVDEYPIVRGSSANTDGRNYVSFLFNKSSDGNVIFDKPYWPNRHGIDGQLPSG